MPHVPIAEIEALVATLHTWVGAELAISESISQNRERGHNRHFATQAGFRMVLGYAGVTFSGANLTLVGAGVGIYQIATSQLVAITYPAQGEIVLVEHFEQRTERLTRLRRIAPPPAVDEGEVAPFSFP